MNTIFKGGFIMHPHNMVVECHVSNCKHNYDNYCQAEKIEVITETGRMTNCSDDTYCSSFIPKDS
ncbi:hypothetical protein CCE28_16850 [Anaeromicrobium sediminis]|uniref:DUF1540 domain-containing protein n=2 Tax=Anaeromicrobium sediminis TaxID=1478221 RepID=A0A267MFH1_9FIRM|nr:hypothetical protein CCE28_16850 [Anaeromicrobium sediminis]